MIRVIDLYCKVVVALMAAALMVMVVLVFGNVVLRYVFNSGITMSEELSRWLMVWLTFLGAIVALREHYIVAMQAALHILQKLPASLPTPIRVGPQ